MGKVSPVQGHKAGLCWGATQAERFRAGSHAGGVGRLPKCVLWAWRLLPPETRCPSVCPHPYFLLPPSTLAGASLPWNGEVGKGKLVECGLVAQSKTCREGGGPGPGGAQSPPSPRPWEQRQMKLGCSLQQHPVPVGLGSIHREAS